MSEPLDSRLSPSQGTYVRQCVWCGKEFAAGTSRSRRIHTECRKTRVSIWRKLWKSVKPQSRKRPMDSSDVPVGSDQATASLDSNNKKIKNNLRLGRDRLDPNDKPSLPARETLR